MFNLMRFLSCFVAFIFYKVVALGGRLVGVKIRKPKGNYVWGLLLIQSVVCQIISIIYLFIYLTAVSPEQIFGR